MYYFFEYQYYSIEFILNDYARLLFLKISFRNVTNFKNIYFNSGCIKSFTDKTITKFQKEDRFNDIGFQFIARITRK